MKILKIILQYKYIFMVIIILGYSIICTSITSNSKYFISDTQVSGYIHNINIDGDKLNIEIIGKEKIIGTYYFKSIEEKNDFNYKLGDYINIDCELKEPTSNTVFNLFNYREYLLHKNIHFTMNINNITKIKDNKNIMYNLKQFIIDRIESINLSKEYLYAFILGDDFYISSDSKKSYQVNGISHLFAVSGMHVGLLIMVLTKLLKRFKYKYFILIFIIIIYMFITNFTSSIVRAGLFFILLTINKEYKFNIKIINVLLLTLFFSLLFNPYLIYDVGFQFSFIISMFLILFQDLIKKSKSKIGKLFIISFISFLGGLPIVLNNYFEFNILSIFLNLIYVPFVSIIIFPLSFICFIIPMFDNLLYLLIQLLEFSSINLSNIKIFIITLGKPTMLLIVIYYIVIVSILYKIKTNKYIFLLLVVPILLNYVCNKNTYPEITFIDVGQGDSILIRLNSKNILIDTGGTTNYNNELWKNRNRNYSIGKDTIIPYLKSLGINRLDYLIITHGDNDHIGEAINIIDGIYVGEVIMNTGEISFKEEELIKYLNKEKIKYSNKKEGDVISVDNYKFYVLNPYKETNENDSSLVIYTKIYNTKILFMGDAGVEVEKYLMNNYDLDIDILKVGHHGSNTSSYPEFIRSLSLDYAIIEVGLNNKFNHPSSSVINTLNNNSIKIYQTSLDGSIKLKIMESNIEFSTCVQ